PFLPYSTLFRSVRDRVSSVARLLPEEATAPQVAKAQSDGRPLIWFNLTSEYMDELELTDYADRFVVDSFSVVDGVASVMLSGAKHYSMRIWLDRRGLAARGLTAADVENALRAENVEFPAGAVKSAGRDSSVRLERSYKTAEDFQRLVLRRGADGYLVRLEDVARVALGPEDERTSYRGN